MNTLGLFSTLRSMRILVVFLALLVAYGAVSYAPQAATPAPVHSFDLGGITGAANNTILAYGRYVLVAPFWPSAGLAENGDLEVSSLDNNSLYVIDTKKPEAPPLSKKLTSWDSKTVYFPTKIVLDPNTNNVYVRGTRFEERNGEITPIDVIAYVGLDLDEGKVGFDTNVVPIDIQGVASEPFTSEAPLDFALGAKGDVLIFTNGASIFSFNIAEGYLNKENVVNESEYSTNNSISFLAVDSATNIVSVCENQKWVVLVGKDKVARVSSRISFYRLGERGEFNLLKRVEAGFSPDGTALTDGSNIAIVSDTDSEFALFVTNDGSVCTVDLLSGEGQQATTKRLYAFPELALSSITDPNPLLINYDSAKRTIGVVKQGFTAQISRPLNGKPGSISRPLNLHATSEAPVLAMAKLNKKNKVVSSNSFTKDFENEGGLSNLVMGTNSEWLISTYSGKLYSLGVADDLKESKPRLIQSIGSRVDRIESYDDRTSVVAISAFTLDEGGMRMASPGSLVFGKLSDLQSQSGSIMQALLPTASMLGRSTPTIRRPCNIKR